MAAPTRPAAALLGLALGLALAALAPGDCCDPEEFLCRDGFCVAAEDRCDGERNCPDGSDEGLPLCSAPNLTLPEGHTVLVRAHFRAEHRAVLLLLCDARECSKVKLAGLNAQGAARHALSTGCGLEGFLCESHMEGSSALPPCALDLLVQRRPDALSVWLPPFPQHAVSVPASPSQTLLRVRPFVWDSAMAVEFSAHTGQASERCTRALGPPRAL